MNELTGKVALVTGGNGGIGLAMASALASAGATIVIVGRNASKNALAVEVLTRDAMPEPLCIEGNMTDENNVREIIEKVVTEMGGLDIVINNVGSNDRKLPQQYSLTEWNDLISSNLTSAFLVSQAAYPWLKNRGGGKIINIGSMLSIFGSAMSAPYAAAKGGVVQMTKSLAVAWASDNIQVNAILPGWIDTDLTVNARKQIPDLEQRVLARTPAGRWGRPEDIGGAAVFLCSPMADFITFQLSTGISQTAAFQQ